MACAQAWAEYSDTAKGANFPLTAYKRRAFEINCRVNWGVGSLIEVTDPVVLRITVAKDTKLNNGERDLGEQLFEVIQRTINIMTGNVSLTLLSNLGATVGTRYGRCPQLKSPLRLAPRRICF